MAEKQYGMLVRTNRCVGCQTCIVGCHLLHECPTDVYLGYLETVGQEENYLVTGTYPKVSVTFRPHLCNHCENPACVANCPTGAMHKREEDGIVESDLCAVVPLRRAGGGRRSGLCDEVRFLSSPRGAWRGAFVRVQLPGRGARVRRDQRSEQRDFETHCRAFRRAAAARRGYGAFGALLLE